MGTMASQITSLTNFNSTIYSGADQRKHQSSTSGNASGNDLPEPILIYHQWGPVKINLRGDDNVGILLLMTDVKRYLSHQLMTLPWKWFLQNFNKISQGLMSQWVNHLLSISYINKLRFEQKGHYFAGKILPFIFASEFFQSIILKENACILIQVLLNYVHDGPIHNNSAMVHIMS